jgi:hypothetical protein
MCKRLKQTVIETVSTLPNLIDNLHNSRDSKIAENSKLEIQVNHLEAELERSRTAKKPGTPSIVGNYLPLGTYGLTIAPLATETQPARLRGEWYLLLEEQGCTRKPLVAVRPYNVSK